MSLPVSKDLLGYLSIAVAAGNTVPYCVWIVRGRIKPHVFSWVIWSVEMGIAAAGQSAEAAGPGAWAMWCGALGCTIIAVLACFHGERRITKGDVLTFTAALAAIPLWQVTSNAFLAIVVVTTIDTLGFYPTMRKSWVNPYQESASIYLISNTIVSLALFATTTYSVATVLYPAVMMINNTILLSIIYWRRWALAPGSMRG